MPCPPFLPMLLAWCVVWTIALDRLVLIRRPGTSSPESGVVRVLGMTLLWIAIDLAIVVWAAIDPIEDPTSSGVSC